MSVREILKFPDKRLRIIAEPVEKFDEYLDTLVKDMFESIQNLFGQFYLMVQTTSIFSVLQVFIYSWMYFSVQVVVLLLSEPR